MKKELSTCNLKNKLGPKMKFKILALVAVSVALGGCTRALVADYREGMSLDANHINGQNLAVHKFQDKRAWIDGSDTKSQSFVGSQSPWKFGLKYKNVEYQAVSNVLQDVFIEEFKALGTNAFKAEDSSLSAFSLDGEILNFEFANEAGMWSVVSRRHVSLALTLTDPNGNVLMKNELFNEVNRENEGGVVRHSTNVDKLMTVALKKVVVAVVERTNAELASTGASLKFVTLNGQDITPGLHYGPLLPGELDMTRLPQLAWQ